MYHQIKKLSGPILWFVGMLIFIAGLIAMGINPQIARHLEIPLTLLMFVLFAYYATSIARE